MFTHTFWRLLISFIAILVVSAVIFMAIRYLDGKAPIDRDSIAGFFKK